MDALRHPLSRWFAFALALGVFLTPEAKAGLYWYEFGGGTTQLLQASSVFGGASPNVMTFGGAAALGGGVRILQAEIPLHLGLQYRALVSSGNGGSYGLQTLYPLLRADLGSNVLFNFGITPLVFASAQGSWVYNSSFARPTGGWAALLGVDYEMPITPEVAFVLGATAQGVLAGGIKSPWPTIEATGVLRFFLGTSAAKRRAMRGSVSGWRYPFGNSMK
jgi:hypothetical protein